MGADQDPIIMDADARLMAFLRAPNRKHSLVIAGHATSITLEDPFWDALKSLAQARGLSVPKLIEDIDERRGTNLSSAIRLYVLHHAQLKQ